MLLLLVVSTTTVFAQEQLPDSDGDTVPDEFDGCPNEAGLPENYGCAAGVVPPDTDGDTIPDVGDTCPEVAGAVELGGCADSDGDRQPDPYDSCPQEAGFSQNFGCPFGVQSDRDGDGIPDREDICVDVAGTPDLGGCSQNEVTDNDGDGVADFVDACFDQAGSPENAGCPEGTVADSDFDGVANAEDACPRQTGSPENNGCMTDADQDFIEDQYDACPDQPGDSINNGCPEGVAPPDTDGDGSPDIYDRCPDQAGANGMDCPDSDGDAVSDIDDLCPTETGDPTLQGCVAVIEVTLPASRAPLTPANAASITELGQLVNGVSQVLVTSNGLFAVQTYTSGILIYDLSSPTLTPAPLESLGSRIALSGNGAILVDTPFDMVNNVPAIQVWDVATRNGLHYVQLNDQPILSQVAVSADGSKFATAHSLVDMFAGTLPEASPNEVRIWETNSGTDVATLAHDASIYQIAFHPDGNRLAVSTANGTVIWDTATQQQLATLDAVAFPFEMTLAFSADGSKLAIGEMEGMVSVWDMTSYSQLYEVQALAQGDFGVSVSGVAFSPDGSLLAVGGGPFADGFIENPNFQLVLLNAADGTGITSLPDVTRPPGTINFSPDGTLLIFNGLNTVEFWGVAQ